MMQQFEFAKPGTIREALDLLGTERAVAQAGGIDLLDMMKEELLSPERIVSLRGINELRFIRNDPKTGLHLGATVTLAELAGHPFVKEKFQALAEAAAAAATPQIRNAATVAGNLCQRPRCWYFRSADFPCLRKGGEICYAQEGENKYHALFDNQLCAIVHPSAIAVPLLAFNARVRSTNGREERDVALAEFFVRPETDVRRETVLNGNEIILEINVPPARPSTKSSYVKLREKQSFDWPLADAAAVLDMDGQTCTAASIVMGAAAPTPMPVPGIATFLKGKKITHALVRTAVELPFADATPLRDNHYKVTLLKAALRRAILQAAGMDPMKEVD